VPREQSPTTIEPFCCSQMTTPKKYGVGWQDFFNRMKEEGKDMDDGWLLNELYMESPEYNAQARIIAMETAAAKARDKSTTLTKEENDEIAAKEGKKSMFAGLRAPSAAADEEKARIAEFFAGAEVKAGKIRYAPSLQSGSAADDEASSIADD
jgi:hypothetical protein